MELGFLAVGRSDACSRSPTCVEGFKTDERSIKKLGPLGPMVSPSSSPLLGGVIEFVWLSTDYDAFGLLIFLFIWHIVDEY